MRNNKILFADDDLEIRDALQLLLTAEGYETIGVSCGKEVLEQMDDTIDLVILDVMMAEMNGYTACSEIRKKYNVPVLLYCSERFFIANSHYFGKNPKDVV